MSAQFFEERSDQSEIKARIVEKYFYAWARVIRTAAKGMGGKIAYIDLYAGPGRYKNGAASTPLLVLERAIADPDLAPMLVTLFNDQNQDNSRTLQGEIDKLPGISRLKHPPEVGQGSIGDDAADYFQKTKLIPSFTFFDPFGYKGLSLRLIQGVVKDWGCDCVFFFNYNRINAGISNPAVKMHMAALFGEKRAEELAVAVDGVRPDLREAAILEAIAEEIRGQGGKYVLPFTFRNSAGTRTSHKLIFVTKHFKGYSIMKEIMAAESSSTDQGVPSLAYSPADASMPLLFSLSRPLERLEGSLLAEFAGRELSVERIYELHSVDTPYIMRNYKAVLAEMEAKNVIAVRSLKARRPAGTFADHLLVRFPSGRQ